MIRRKKIAFKPVIRKTAVNNTPKSITSGSKLTTSSTVSDPPNTNVSKETIQKNDASKVTDSSSSCENNNISASQNQLTISFRIDNASITEVKVSDVPASDSVSLNISTDEARNDIPSTKAIKEIIIREPNLNETITNNKQIVNTERSKGQPPVRQAAEHDLSTVDISSIGFTVVDGTSASSQTDATKHKAASSLSIPNVPAIKTKEQIVKEQFGVEDKNIRQRNALKKLKNIETMHQNATAEDWNNMVRDSLLVSDLIYCNPPKNAAKELGLHATLRKMQKKEKQHKESSTSDNTQTHNRQDENESEQVTSQAPTVIAPQIRLNEDGSIVLDEESLLINSSKPETVVRDTPVVYENSFSRINHTNFRRFPIVKRSVWSEKQTKKFYEALKIVGADFNLMSAMFRNRTDQQLRKKFHRERKKHNWKVDEALKQQHLSKWTNDMFKPDSSSDEEIVACPKRPRKRRSNSTVSKKRKITTSESIPSSEAVVACNQVPVT